jgi:hypothetical protein
MPVRVRVKEEYIAARVCKSLGISTVVRNNLGDDGGEQASRV